MSTATDTKRKPPMAMEIRELGLRVFEMRAGPFVFLISQGRPAAYRDKRPDAPPPGLYRTDKPSRKATTRHLNLWLKGKGPHAVLPDDQILAAWNRLGEWIAQGAAADKADSIAAPPPERLAEAFEYLARMARGETR